MNQVCASKNNHLEVKSFLKGMETTKVIENGVMRVVSSYTSPYTPLRLRREIATI